MSKAMKSIVAELINSNKSSEGDIAEQNPKRGRPAQYGKKDAWMLYRAMLIIEGFHKFRMEGHNTTVSWEKTVKYVKELHPKSSKSHLKNGMPVSVGTVKRVLAYCRPRDKKERWVVERRKVVIPTSDDWDAATLGSELVGPAWKDWKDLDAATHGSALVAAWMDFDVTALGSVIDQHEVREVLEFSVGKPPKYLKNKKRMPPIDYSKKPKKVR